MFKENFLKILLKIAQDILDMSLEESGLGTLGEIMTGEKGAGQPPVSTRTFLGLRRFGDIMVSLNNHSSFSLISSPCGGL